MAITKSVLASSSAKNGTGEDKIGVATFSVSRADNVVNKCRVLVKILSKKNLAGDLLKKIPK